MEPWKTNRGCIRLRKDGEKRKRIQDLHISIPNTQGFAVRRIPLDTSYEIPFGRRRIRQQEASEIGGTGKFVKQNT